MMTNCISRFLMSAACVSMTLTSCAQESVSRGSGRFNRYAGGMSMESTILGESISYDILLPEGYTSEPGKRYPVVYMLHGYGDDNTSWNDRWLRIEDKVEELEGEGLVPMIYVFPNGFNSYYCNTYDGTFRYMDMFTEELIPYIDKTYRTVADRDHRAIIGYSMGGFGAMVLPMKHPELFSVSVPLSMSFRTDEQYMNEPQDGWNSQWGSIFGGVGMSGEDRITGYYRQHCPFYQFIPENAQTLSQVKWFLHCGDDEEQLLIANDDLHVQMREYGYEHEYRVANGAHTSDYWRNSLDEVLPYIQSVMEGENAWQWTDTEPDVPEITLEEDGTFASEAFDQESETPGTALYLVYSDMDNAFTKEITAILQRGVSARPYMILPCDLSEHTLKEWTELYESRYNVGGSAERRQAAAFGEAGKEVYGMQQMFCRLYFDNASLTDGTENVTASPGIFYHIGQTDDGENCRDMGALYKSCKATGATFQYRVRNGLDDNTKSVLIGTEMIKQDLEL